MNLDGIRWEKRGEDKMRQTGRKDNARREEKRREEKRREEKRREEKRREEKRREEKRREEKRREEKRREEKMLKLIPIKLDAISDKMKGNETSGETSDETRCDKNPWVTLQVDLIMWVLNAVCGDLPSWKVKLQPCSKSTEPAN